MFGEPFKDITVLIAPAGQNVIEVRWDGRFPAMHDRQIRRALADCLETIEGVEAVVMRRYSALVEVAVHVLELKIVNDLVFALFDDEASLFLSDPGVRLANVRFNVISSPRPITKI